MIKFLSLCLFSAALALHTAPATPEATLSAKTAPRPALDKPNVVIVFLDDAGYGDFEHNGNPTISTPNISKLANGGASFTQFYVASPACSASRYALLTGRVPGRSGLGSYVIGPSTQRHIHLRETTLAEGLKARGYATGMFGKWHLGSPNAGNHFSTDTLPLAHGFDQWIGTNVSHDYDDAMLLESDPVGTEPAKGYRVLAKNLPSYPEVCETLTARYTEAAVSFIRANRDQPFLAYVALNMPHLGLYCSDKFKGQSRRGLLGDVMAEVDDCVGRLLRALEEEGLDRNTLFILSSDNGPWLTFMNTASHPKYGEARLNVGYAQPFRNGKGSVWEGGSRVPGIFYWPGTIPAARRQEPASTLDVLPTVFAIAGEKLPADRTIDGRDLRSLLAPGLGGSAIPEQVYTYPDSRNQLIAIRQGPWKLLVGIMQQIKDPDGGFPASPEKPLLFQLEQDLGERIDRAATEPDKVAELKKLLAERQTQIKNEGSFWDKDPAAASFAEDEPGTH